MLIFIEHKSKNTNFLVVLFLWIMLSVAEHTRSKLNIMQALLPEGLLAPTSWLERQGYSRSLIASYVKGGWLQAPARGVYRRPGQALKWQHVVASLARFMERPPHIGGITALEQQGRAHFIPLGGDRPVHLWGPAALPAWVHSIAGMPPFVFHRDTLFSGAYADSYTTPLLARERGGVGPKVGEKQDAEMQGDSALHAGLNVMRWGEWGWELPISTLERAYLEVLDGAPRSDTVEHAVLLLEGLHTLSPRRLSALLRDCRSVKVKRLFLALADRQRHPWFGQLDLAGVDIGKGKLSLVPGGKYDAKYRITLPGGLDDRH